MKCTRDQTWEHIIQFTKMLVLHHASAGSSQGRESVCVHILLGHRKGNP